jgi:hypothetical protein
LRFSLVFIFALFFTIIGAGSAVAKLRQTDADLTFYKYGRENTNGKGASGTSGQLNINIGDWASETYTCILFADGKAIDTRKMMISKVSPERKSALLIAVV